MPEPGRAPEPLFKGLPYGANALANARAADIPDPTDAPVQDEMAGFQPQTPQEQFLLGPTDRPGEPVTAGYSFGPGTGYPRAGTESDSDFINRVADALAAAPQSKEVRAFIDRVKRGY